jgi:hypothetical protein
LQSFTVICRVQNIGGTVGGQAGYNIQDGNFVYGVEADWNWTSTKSDKTLSDACVCGGTTVVQVHSEMDWVATARGRAGLAVGSTLAYVGAYMWVTMSPRLSSGRMARIGE